MDQFLSLYRNDKLAFLATTVLFLFPLGMASVKSWATVSFFLLIVFSLLALRRQSNESLPEQNWLIAGAVAFVVCVLLSFFNSDDLANSYKRLGRIFTIVFFVPLMFGFRRMPIPTAKVIGASFALCCFVMGGGSLYATLVQGKPRAMGYYHPIIFGDMAIVVAAIAACFLVAGLSRGVSRWIVIVAIPVALMASFLSQSRGGWFAIPAVAVLLLVLHADQIDTKKFLAGLTLLLITVFASPFLFPGTVGKQVDRTYKSVEQFVNGGQQNTSIGARFLMWDIAIQIWQENPLVGSGLGDFRHDSRVMIESGKTNLSRPWHHAHSIYFEYLAMTGLLGFFSMIATLLLIPFYLFYRYWRLAESPEEKFFTLSGMIIVTCFAVFGLSEVWLARSAFVASYALLLGVFLSTLGHFKRVSSTS